MFKANDIVVVEPRGWVGVVERITAARFAHVAVPGLAVEVTVDKLDGQGVGTDRAYSIRPVDEEADAALIERAMVINAILRTRWQDVPDNALRRVERLLRDWAG